MRRRREIYTGASMVNTTAWSPRWGIGRLRALEKRFQDIHLDAVYSSDLFRTQTTAKALYLPKGLPLQLEPGLREISMGDWEDDTWGGAARKHPEQMAYFSGGNAHLHPHGRRELSGAASAGGVHLLSSGGG